MNPKEVLKRVRNQKRLEELQGKANQRYLDSVDRESILQMLHPSERDEYDFLLDTTKFYG